MDRSINMRTVLTRGPLYFVVIAICVLWSIPTFGVFVSSLRTEYDINTSGWWTAFAIQRQNPALDGMRRTVETRQNAVNIAERDLATARTELEAAQTALAALEGSDDAEALAEAEAAVEAAEARVESVQARVESVTARLLEAETAIDESGIPEHITIFSPEWSSQWTTANYDAVLNVQNMGVAFINSLLVTIPSVVIPITIAAFAAYAFAWMEFPGRDLFFAVVVVLMVVPLHVALVPVLRLYVGLDLNGTFLGIWLAHAGFGMPLAIYLLYGYISTIPREIIESAKVDGASPFTTFTRLVLPLSVPAVASFAIFQFLWVWNDLLVALVFLGTRLENRVLTRELSELVGSRGQDWELLTAGAFVSMVIPLLVFFALQRYFVRGMMAGSVKG